MRSDRAGVRTWAAGLLLIVPALDSVALEYTLSAEYEAEYTDNAGLATDDKSSDVIHRPGLNATIAHAGAAIQADAQYRVYRRIYQDDTFDSDTPAEGSANISWSALPERLRFFAGAISRETEIESAGRARPDNLQQMNQVSAGAELSADLWSSHYGTLSYTYVDTSADRTATDSERHVVEATYGIPLSATSSLRLIGTGTSTDFAHPLATDYESGTGTLAYQRLTATGAFDAHVGYSSFDREGSSESTNGVIGGVSISRQIGGRSSIGLSYDLDYDDNSLRSRVPDGFPTDVVPEEFLPGDSDLTEIFRQHSLVLTLRTRLGVNELTLTGVGRTQDYEGDVDRDADRYGGRLEIARRLRPSMTGSLGLAYQRNEFDAGGSDDEYTARLQLSWEASRRLNVGGYVEYFDRRSSADLSGRAVEEWSVAIRLAYLLMDQRQGGFDSNRGGLR